MKIAVMSDTHYIAGATRFPVDFWQQLEGVDRICHCGDIGDRALYEDLSAIVPITAVLGNNDGPVFGGILPERHVFVIDGVRIGMFHGHRGKAPFGFGREEIDLLLCGHTHVPRDEMIDGIRVINPGSVTRPRGGSGPAMGLLEINEQGIAWQPIALHRD